jgi:hypothetical protein
MRPTMRFGKKVALPSTTAIMHQLRAVMRESDKKDEEALARENEARLRVPAKS